MPGAWRGVYRRGQARAVGAGTANLNTGQPMTLETGFLTGSITKVWHARLLMTFVDEGRLALGEPAASARAMATRTIDGPTGPASGLGLGWSHSTAGGRDHDPRGAVGAHPGERVDRGGSAWDRGLHERPPQPLRHAPDEPERAGAGGPGGRFSRGVVVP